MGLSLRKAINEKCKECIYDPLSGQGNWRQQVEACTSRTCPLYAVRPTSSGNEKPPVEEVHRGVLSDLSR